MNVGLEFSTKPKCRRQEPEKGGRKLQTNQNEETSSRRSKPNGLRRMDLSQPEYNRRTVEGIQQNAAVRYQSMEFKSKKR